MAPATVAHGWVEGYFVFTPVPIPTKDINLESLSMQEVHRPDYMLANSFHTHASVQMQHPYKFCQFLYTEVRVHCEFLFLYTTHAKIQESFPFYDSLPQTGCDQRSQ